MSYYNAICLGELEFSGEKIPCAVLENGMRVIPIRKFPKFFSRAYAGSNTVEGRINVINSKNFNKFISEDLIEKSKTISFRHKNGKMSTGYNAEVIPLVCDVIINAENEGCLYKSQQDLYDKAIEIISVLAKISIESSIDEVTGYRSHIDFSIIEKSISKHIDEKLLEWQLKFPRDYYLLVCKLNGIGFEDGEEIIKFTKEYVYKYLNEDTMKRLMTSRPFIIFGSKVYRNKYISVDIGNGYLNAYVHKLIGVMKLSKDIDNFKDNFKKAFDEEIELTEKK